MAPRLSGQNCKFLEVSFVYQFPRDLESQKTAPNIEVRSDQCIEVYMCIEPGRLRRGLNFCWFQIFFKQYDEKHER